MKPSRKQGAQPRNKNALKHGIYAQFVTLSDDKSMVGMSDKSTKCELTQARINYRNAMQQRSKTTDTKDYLACDFACHYWLETIIDAKLRAKEAQETGVVVFDTFIDAIRAANDRQGVKK
ncbi:MAG: hypothetical protein NTW99_10830 [Chloroflexi bacterium]|nr:hypothetical protein [Chloroflexota bacterium]